MPFKLFCNVKSATAICDELRVLAALCCIIAYSELLHESLEIERRSFAADCRVNSHFSARFNLMLLTILFLVALFWLGKGMDYGMKYFNVSCTYI